DAEASGVDTGAARESLYAAEGSDWFWWFGDDFHTEFAAEFDALFRGHIAAAWRALGRTPPTTLLEPIKLPTSAPALHPVALLSPRLDGRCLRYHDWLGAARYRAGGGAGSM